MSDDLQRYRPEYPGFMIPDPDGVWVDRREVADRIEALEAELASGSFYKESDIDALMAERDAAQARADALAEKLEKAVARLTAMRDDREGYRHIAHFRRGAAVELAQITGGKADE